MLCLSLGTLEVVSILVRKRNAGLLSGAAFSQAMLDLRAEIIDPPEVTKVLSADYLVWAAIPLVQTHSINSNDAVMLSSALEAATHLRAGGDDLMLVAADQRLLRAARAEGLTVFDPQTQTEADLDALLGP